MKLVISIIFTLVLTISEILDTVEGNNVLVLNKDNFEKTISENDYVLVDFYTTWCGFCKVLEPEYAEAAKILIEKQSEIKLATVNAEEEDELRKTYKVTGYPTLLYFRKGVPIEYGGDYLVNDLVQWLTLKAGPPATQLSTAEDLKSFIDSAPVVVVGFFNDQQSAGAKAFLDAANAEADIPYGITFNDTIMLFTKSDGSKSIFDTELTEPEIKKFVNVQSQPLIIDFGEPGNERLSEDIGTYLFIFLSKESAHYDRYLKGLENVAKEFRGQMTFVTINTDDENKKTYLDLLGVKKEELPGMRIITTTDTELSKYKPERESVDEDNVRAFVQDFVDGKLQKHLHSQDLPEDWDKHPVKILVSSNFDSVALNASKNVLVYFYTPWCGACKELEPIYEQLAEKFKSRDDTIIAKIDASQNDNQHTNSVNLYPTIKFYAKEDNHEVEYDGDLTIDDLTKFVESGGVNAETTSSYEDVVILTTEKETADFLQPENEGNAE